MTKAIGRQKKPSDDGLPCISPYRAGQKPPVVTGGYLFIIIYISSLLNNFRVLLLDNFSIS